MEEEEEYIEKNKNFLLEENEANEGFNNEKAEKEVKGSNSSVMDLSSDEGGEEKETNDKNDGNINTLNKSFDNKLNFTKILKI